MQTKPPLMWTRRLSTFAIALIVAALALMAVPIRADAVGEVGTFLTVSAAADGLSIHVEGDGYTGLPNASTNAPAAGLLVVLRDAATMPDSAINADTSLPPAAKYIPKALIAPDGSFAADLVAPVAKLSPDANYEVIVWVAHGYITPETLLDTVPFELTDTQKQTLFPDWTAPTTTTTAAPTTTTTAAPTTTVAPQTTTTAAASLPAGQRCETVTVPGRSGVPQLNWGVKSSFVAYLDSAASGGKITVSNGAARVGIGFTWGAGSGTLDASNRGTLSFPGSVNFTAHGGAMNLTLSNLRVRVTGPNVGVLIADIQSVDMDGNPAGGTGVSMANLQFSSLNSSGGTSSVTITEEGAKAFAGFYKAGDSMDPLTLSFSGASGPTTELRCYDALGNLINSTPGSGAVGANNQLPRTGSGTTTLFLVGASMSVLGFGLLFASKKWRWTNQ